VNTRTILTPIWSRRSAAEEPTRWAGSRRGLIAALAIVGATIAFLSAIDYTWSTLLTVLGAIIRGVAAGLVF
jgi:hypothetical protein